MDDLIRSAGGHSDWRQPQLGNLPDLTKLCELRAELQPIIATSTRLMDVQSHRRTLAPPGTLPAAAMLTFVTGLLR
jgi:hypothetical protein